MSTHIDSTLVNAIALINDSIPALKIYMLPEKKNIIFLDLTLSDIIKTFAVPILLFGGGIIVGIRNEKRKQYYRLKDIRIFLDAWLERITSALEHSLRNIEKAFNPIQNQELFTPINLKFKDPAVQEILDLDKVEFSKTFLETYVDKKTSIRLYQRINFLLESIKEFIEIKNSETRQIVSEYKQHSEFLSGRFIDLYFSLKNFKRYYEGDKLDQFLNYTDKEWELKIFDSNLKDALTEFANSELKTESIISDIQKNDAIFRTRSDIANYFTGLNNYSITHQHTMSYLTATKTNLQGYIDVFKLLNTYTKRMKTRDYGRWLRIKNNISYSVLLEEAEMIIKRVDEIPQSI